MAVLWNHDRLGAFIAPICSVAQCRHDLSDEGILRSSLIIAGAIILLLGIAGIAVPYFTTEQTKQQSHVIPPLLSDAAVAIGVVLLGVGLVRRA
jgi:hypothetical protein